MSALLEAGHRRAEAITRQHATTYYWGARLLPEERRRQVHAVYALCRTADDVVDSPGATSPGRVAGTAQRLTALEQRFEEVRAGAPTDDPVLAVAADAAERAGIAPSVFRRFFGAMRQDLTTTRYETWDDLLGYMDGSAATIGEMMLPVLGATSPDALGPARSLGLAFQLTNFLRDVSEDLGRGRVYLPQAELRAAGVDPAGYRAGLAVDEPWRAFMRGQIARNRELYRAADAGLPHLPSAARRCVTTAYALYSGILDRIERADHDVFGDRVHVPTPAKVVLTGRVLTGTWSP